MHRKIGLLSASILAMTAGADDRVPVSAIDEAAIKRSFIAFVTATSMPGVEGAVLRVKTPNRTSDIMRSSLAFSAEFTLPDRIENGYWGAGIITATHSDQISLSGPDNEAVELDVNRSLLGARFSFGWSVPVTSHFKVKPYLTGNWMQIDSSSSLSVAPSNGDQVQLKFDSRLDALSVAANLDMEYQWWQGRTQWLLLAQANGMYTDSLERSSKNGFAEAWTHAAKVGGQVVFDSPWLLDDRYWRWRLYYHYTDFTDIDQVSLGYTHQHELGVGLDWQMSIKPLNLFGWEYIGFQMGLIGGENLQGLNVGLAAR